MQDMMHHCLSPSLLERQRAHLQWQQQQYVSNDNFQYYPNDTREEVTTPSPTTTTTTTTSSAQVGKEKSSKKRKADKYSPMVGGDEGEKRMKGDDQGSDRREDSGNISKEKPDYIHVRARRGQATDSHSLAERVRRERISERMKCLQGLVPGCSKITGKAGMLDEIINYVQSLQRQVEFLSMKLAAVNPRLDFNMESLFTKEMNLPSKSDISTVGMSPPEVGDLTILQLHSLQQAVASWGFDMDMAINPAEVAVRTPISTPATSPETLLDSSINVQRTNAGWDNDYGSAFPFHSLQGNILSNLKYEM